MANAPYLRGSATEWLNDWLAMQHLRGAAYNGDGAATRLTHNELFTDIPTEVYQNPQLDTADIYDELVDTYSNPSADNNMRDVGIPLQRQLAVVESARKAELSRRQGRVQSLANTQRATYEALQRAREFAALMLNQRLGAEDTIAS